LLLLSFILKICDSRHAERDPSLLIGNDNSQPVISLGICGSLLPAAAAAVANDVGELIEVSTFLATVACRLAVQVTRRSMQIEDDGGAWAFSTIGEIVTQLPSILEQFHEDLVSQKYFTSFITSWEKKNMNSSTSYRKFHNIDKHISPFKQLRGPPSSAHHLY
jgi:Starter unit:ACP transacylase in aflatoxin biosynthesis